MDKGISVDIEVFASGRVKLSFWDPATGERGEINAHYQEMAKLRDSLTDAVNAAEGFQGAQREG